MISYFDAAIPLNKQLYTLSYVFLTAGAAALVFSAIYTMVYCLLSLFFLLDVIKKELPQFLLF